MSEEVIACCRCKKSVAKSELRDHLSQHLHYNPTMCGTCFKRFVSLDKLRLHIQLSAATDTPCLSLSDSDALEYPDAAKEQELRQLLDACSTQTPRSSPDQTLAEKEKESPAAVAAAPLQTPVSQDSLPTGSHTKQPMAYKSILGSPVPSTRNTIQVPTGHPEKRKIPPPSTLEPEKRMKTAAEESLTSEKDKNVKQPVQSTNVQEGGESTRNWELFKIHPTTKNDKGMSDLLRNNAYSPCQKCGEMVYRSLKRAHCKEHITELMKDLDPADYKATLDELFLAKRVVWFPNTRWEMGDQKDAKRRESSDRGGSDGGVQKELQSVLGHVTSSDGSSLRDPQPLEQEQLRVAPIKKEQIELESGEQQPISHFQQSQVGAMEGSSGSDGARFWTRFVPDSLH